MATSYNGWTASRYPSVIGINQNFSVLGHKFPGGVKGGDVETVFRYLITQLDARVEKIGLYAPGDEWGYSYRVNTNNTSQLSCHASGTAIDYNATRHPNGKAGTFSAAQVAAIRGILAELGGVIRWGGDFSGVKDEMHFEILGTAAQVAAVASRIRSGQIGPAPVPAPAPSPVPVFDFLEILKMDPLACVNFAFTNFLGRKPESLATIAYHMDIAKAYGLDGLVGAVVNSEEGKRLWGHAGGVNATHFAAVVLSFETVLGRHPGYGSFGLSALQWGAGRVATVSLGGFMTELIQSPEGQTRYGA